MDGIHEGQGYLHAFGIRIALARIDDLEEPGCVTSPFSANTMPKTAA
ncbi:MAG: hypothetical protein IPK20_09585 [Betaproteobacteria bacterium]|nr:hypothetical protein [Betaproteobacteria bacterium]